MDIQDLRIFSRLARVQSLSTVGTELDLSPATISKRLQSLEAELSARVFDRSTRAICLTQEGEMLLGHVERILGEVDAALAAVSANVEHPRGRLRVSAPTGLGRGVLAPAICTFMAIYPEIELVVDTTDRVVSFPDAGYDVAIRVGKLEDSALIARLLSSEAQVVVAAPSYLERHAAPDAPGALSQHSCLLFGDAQQWSFTRIGVSADVKPVDVKVCGRLRSDNNELLRHAAIEGHGVLRASHARVADDIRRGLLAPLLADWVAVPGASIYAVYPSSRHVLPKLKVFVEFLATWYQDKRRNDRAFYNHNRGALPADSSLEPNALHQESADVAAPIAEAPAKSRRRRMPAA